MIMERKFEMIGIDNNSYDGTNMLRLAKNDSFRSFVRCTYVRRFV